jgi:glycosyltransferase involved in cell wall biosynthesis
LLTQIALQGDVICLTMQRYVDWLARNYSNIHSMHIPVGAYHIPELLSYPENQAAEILFFTTLAPYKGLEVLLEAFQTLQREIPNLRLTIAGAEHPRFPGYTVEIRRKTAGMSGIRWLGQVAESQVRDLYQQSQIVCIPYTASTGSSSVLYQAAMWGRPVVASDLAETRSVARESNLEVAFFQSGSAASLAESLKTLLNSSELRSNQVARNFTAIQRIRPEDVCQAYLRAFNQALEMHSSPNRLPIPSQLDQRPA